jgi:hypothetical protein
MKRRHWAADPAALQLFPGVTYQMLPEGWIYGTESKMAGMMTLNRAMS